MSKRSKSNDVQRGLICRLDDKHHFRMFNSLLMDTEFKRLSNSAKVLYTYMGLQSKGKAEFQFPQTAYIDFMTKPTFIKAKRELINGGYISERREGYLTVYYRFSNEWLNKKNTAGKVERPAVKERRL